MKKEKHILNVTIYEEDAEFLAELIPSHGRTLQSVIRRIIQEYKHGTYGENS